jgi:hypothetical protein
MVVVPLLPPVPKHVWCCQLCHQRIPISVLSTLGPQDIIIIAVMGANDLSGGAEYDQCLESRASIILCTCSGQSVVPPYCIMQSSAIGLKPQTNRNKFPRAISNRRNDMNELLLAHFLISLSITSYRQCLTFVTHT